MLDKVNITAHSDKKLQHWEDCYNPHKKVFALLFVHCTLLFSLPYYYCKLMLLNTLKPRDKRNNKPLFYPVIH